jgi:hypothetical protein
MHSQTVIYWRYMKPQKRHFQAQFAIPQDNAVPFRTIAALGLILFSLCSIFSEEPARENRDG